jgi:hypothetical protein
LKQEASNPHNLAIETAQRDYPRNINLSALLRTYEKNTFNITKAIPQHIIPTSASSSSVNPSGEVVRDAINAHGAQMPMCWKFHGANYALKNCEREEGLHLCEGEL